MDECLRPATHRISGDTDLSLVACDLGFGTGTFASLKLTHVIPKRRLTESYMEQLLREMNYSLRLLAAKRGHRVPTRSRLRQLWENIVVRRRGRREFRFYRATHLGTKMADAEIRNWTNGRKH